MPGRLCVGVVVGAHGVAGAVRIRTFTERPADAAAYGPVEDEGGTRHFSIAATGRTRDGLIARLEGIADRDAALALKGSRLYVPRAVLPATGEEEYYHSDLVGLAVEDTCGAGLGRVIAVFDFGAGDVIEIEGEDGGRRMLAFTRRNVPVIDLAGGRLVVDPPVESEADGDKRD